MKENERKEKEKKENAKIICMTILKGDGNPDDYYVLYERS